MSEVVNDEDQRMREAFRGTLEYSAAFDLELWKVEQQRLFQKQLEEQRHSIEQKIAEEQARKLEAQMSDIDALRGELEGMAKRLQATGEVLQRRIAQLESREVAFEARRTQVAVEQERHLARMEDRSRRQLEEEKAKQRVLQDQLNAAQATSVAAEQRATAVQQEYDALQRYFTRVNSDQTDYDSKLRAMEEQLITANQIVSELQRAQVARDERVKCLESEKMELISACRLYKTQLLQLTLRYNELQDEWNAREEETLAKERARLASVEICSARRTAAPASTALLSVQGGPLRTSARPTAGTQAAAAATEEVAEADASDSVDLRDFKAFVQTLQERFRRPSGASRLGAQSEPPRPTLQYAEVPFDSSSGMGQHPIARQAIFDGVRSGAGDMHDISMSTMSTVEMEARDCERHNHGRCHSRRRNAAKSQRRAKQFSPQNPVSNSGGREPGSRAGPDGGALSSSSGSETEDGLGASVGSEESALARSPSSSTSETTAAQPRNSVPESAAPQGACRSLPPLPPAASLLRLHDQVPISSSRAPLTAPKQPEPSCGSAVLQPPPLSARSSATRGEMEHFVQQLKVNRSKLVDSGVYEHTDALIAEMDRKIALYEQYLELYFT